MHSASDIQSLLSLALSHPDAYLVRIVIAAARESGLPVGPLLAAEVARRAGGDGIALRDALEMIGDAQGSEPFALVPSTGHRETDYAVRCGVARGRAAEHLVTLGKRDWGVPALSARDLEAVDLLLDCFGGNIRSLATLLDHPTAKLRQLARGACAGRDDLQWLLDHFEAQTQAPSDELLEVLFGLDRRRLKALVLAKVRTASAPTTWCRVLARLATPACVDALLALERGEDGPLHPASWSLGLLSPEAASDAARRLAGREAPLDHVTARRLGTWGGAEALRRLVAQLHAPHRRHWLAAVEGLRRAGAPAVEALAALDPRLTPDWVAVAALGILGRGGAGPSILMPWLGHPARSVRAAAVEALSVSGADGVVGALERLALGVLYAKAAERGLARKAGGLGRHADLAMDALERLLRTSRRPGLQPLVDDALQQRDEAQARFSSNANDCLSIDVDPAVEAPQVSLAAPSISSHAYFSVACPHQVRPGDPVLVDVWCHAETPEHFFARALHRHADLGRRSHGPVALPDRVTLEVSLALAGYAVADNGLCIAWLGDTGAVSFMATPLADARLGVQTGVATVCCGGAPVAHVHFQFEVAQGPAATDRCDATTYVARVRSAFASYASEDYEAVMARIQGMNHVMGGLDIFVDVHALRAGEAWRERVRGEIVDRDALYLFWSAAASRSPWVDYEWRTALQARGPDFIEPVPLEQGPHVAIPPELSHKHFGDRWLLRRS